MEEWLLRCSTCKKVYASVSVPFGEQMMWESPVAIVGCHPTPSGGPGLEVVVREEPFSVVCQMLSGTEKDMGRSEVCFSFHDGRAKWFFVRNP